MRMSGIFALGRTGMLVNGWRSDRRREARRHTAWAAAVGALGLMLAAVAQQAGSSLGLLAAPALSAAGTMGSIPVFWSLPPRYMSGTALAAGVALINSCANLAGYFAPRFLGGMKESTGSYGLGLFAIAGVDSSAWSSSSCSSGRSRRRSPQPRRTPGRPTRRCPEVTHAGRLLKQQGHLTAVYRKWDPKY
ncbi:hypothetical protein [Streptomyces sp. NPDC059916]|uniref:hypothetical protein n=1 Tax=Streptomyces sp. NPDC059916 TaxID=3347001 RepID=UPI003688BD01